MIVVTPFNFLCHVLPSICNIVSIFTHFNLSVWQLGPTRGHLKCRISKPARRRHPSLIEPTKPNPHRNPNPACTYCSASTSTRPHRFRAGHRRTISVDRIPHSSSYVSRVSGHHGDQPCTILAVAWRVWYVQAGYEFGCGLDLFGSISDGSKNVNYAFELDCWLSVHKGSRVGKGVKD